MIAHARSVWAGRTPHTEATPCESVAALIKWVASCCAYIWATGQHSMAAGQAFIGAGPSHGYEWPSRICPHEACLSRATHIVEPSTAPMWIVNEW